MNNFYLFIKSIILICIIINIKNDNFNLKNFGSFKILNKKARIGRNPKTNEIHEISERKALSFIPSKKLIKKINN